MIKIGVDYYPEQWNKKEWERDANLMQQTGVRVVRLAEFAWSKLVPEEGVYDFDWLYRIIEIFEERNMELVLCTPTNCPPLWFYEKYPETIQIGRDGQPIALGIRGHRCYNNKVFRQYAQDIIEKMTLRYGHKTSVIAWQIDNEVESNFCCCKSCSDAFQEWLKAKHHTIEAVNEAYGNNVWSGEYSDWSQIKPPFGSYPLGWYNPGYMLDFHRYAAESIAEYVDFQASIIRKNIPHAMITTNTWMCEHIPDYHKLFKNLDFVSYDNYPTTSIPEDSEAYYSHAFHLDLMRGIKQKNFWIMEQLSGTPGCWMPMQATPRPGMIKGYSLQAIARGADTVIHFRWRTAVSGAEMFWHGVIDHSNVAGRRWSEFKDLCDTVNELNEVEESQITNQCAMIYTYEQDCSLRIQPQTEGFHYYNQMKAIHHGLTSLGVGVDIVSEEVELEKYKVVILPTVYIVNPKFVQKVYDFAKNGGIVILTNRSGVKDQNNNCIMEQLPTVYRDLTGCVVEEYDAIGFKKVRVQDKNGIIYEGKQWCDILLPINAEVLATYMDFFYSGKAAITYNKYHKGGAYYIGTVGNKALYRSLLKDALEQGGINYFENLPETVELSVRKTDKVNYIFLFNNSQNKQKFIFMEQTIEMEPFGMYIHKAIKG
mgnify:CR=1 FL=1